MEMHDLLDGAAPKWMTPGRGHSILSLHLFLSRNLSGYAFPHEADGRARQAVAKEIEKAALTAAPDFQKCLISSLSANERELLWEKQFLPEGDTAPEEEVLYTDGPGAVSFLVNGEDHLVIQAAASGQDVLPLWHSLSRLDDRLGQNLSYDFDREFGYLTASPELAGTGLRLAADLFLPGTAASGAVPQAAEAAARAGFTLQQADGGNTSCRYRLSNAVSMGLTEEQLARRMTDLLHDLSEAEASLWARVFQQDENGWKDRIWRALGTLKYARLIEENEAAGCAGWIRLGIEEEMFPSKDPLLFEKLLMEATPSYVRCITHKEEMNEEEEKLWRAVVLRNQMTEAGL